MSQLMSVQPRRREIWMRGRARGRARGPARHEYHPRTRKLQHFQTLDVRPGRLPKSTFSQDVQSAVIFLGALACRRPWSPLRTRADFEFMDLATRLLAKGDDLAKLIHRAGPARS
jgi:hypothetical protein